MRWRKTWAGHGAHTAGNKQHVIWGTPQAGGGAHLAAGLAHYHGEVARQRVGRVVEGDVEHLDVGGRPECTLDVECG